MKKDVQDKLKKLSITSWSELSLLIPKSFEDYRLYNHLQEHTFMCIDATVQHITKTPNSLQVTFFVHNFGHILMGVLFKPKPYMIHQFKVGSRDYYYGLVECKMGQCTMAMPKKITKPNEVVPKYKTTLRNDVMQRFVKENLTYENLVSEGLKKSVVEKLLELHFPKVVYKELSKESLYALKYTELFVFMKQLAKKRKYFSSLSSTCRSYEPWLGTLPFELTNEQLKAINDIKLDLQKDVSAKRMVVGDVGCGKTMVILATAYMNYPNKTVLMAPTTILANQLFEEAQKFLPNLKTVLVTNKTKKIDLNEFDFVVGTHAVLYRDLPKASVVMVDEQHRFGTKQRNLLEKLMNEGEKKPHYIQFSATPIPRTQAMIETAHIDVSLITTTPFKKNIKSKVIHKQDFKNLIAHIKDEIEQNHQVLLVYPLVEESDAIAYQSIEEARTYWEKNFEDVYVTHGKDKEKEKVLLEFRKKGSILIATTVVEVGISLPRLSTVVIVGAERLGLSTLHQLRGRVSRTGLQGYCFLYTNQSNSKRLEEFVTTTSGFDIANMDLKYRKSGDLLKGVNQSGMQFEFVDMVEDEQTVKEVKKDLQILEVKKNNFL